MLKKQILFIFLLFMIFTITGCKNSTKKLEEFPEIVNKLENYKVLALSFEHITENFHHFEGFHSNFHLFQTKMDTKPLLK